jgi:mono/diheme cytochrome c family protein
VLTASLAALLVASPSSAQINLDARKTAAEIFADNCGVCHKSPGALKRTNAAFLRRHYSTGPAQATAMAAYLTNLPPEQRNLQQSTEAKQQPNETRPPSNGEHVGPLAASAPAIAGRAASAKPVLEAFEE